ncbi:MAG: DUF6600 domain-containing protein [Dokdonella sp.]
MYTKRLSNTRGWCAAALVFVLGAVAGNAMADPPDRVARVSFMQGDVSFQPSGDDQWAQASLNRPLSTGDKVYTDSNSRVELEIGAANIRLDEHTTFNLLNLADNAAQIELTDGVMNLHVRGLGNGQSVEVDTPTLAFVVNRPGNYRIDVAPHGGSTMVTVFDGAGDAYGENNASYSVRAGNSYRFNDSALHDYEVLDLPRQDDFDRWCDSRNRRYEHSVSSAYVPEDMIGYADLDDNGSWSDVPEYGHVWYPTTVAADWAPYRSGHWSWIDPWGWTWVDAAAWGFAPFHYGRWAYVDDRWGWCPGERRRWGSVYAPALVGFAGGNGWGVSIGGGGPVGWFPLGPRDVYVPWYSTSRDYFTNINVRNSRSITNINITNVYNNYSSGRPITNVNYAYRGDARAITAVSRETFIGSRAVGGARVQVNESLLRNTQVASRMSIAPTRASFVAEGVARGRAAPAATLDRRVVARTAPPAAALPIASRMQAIQRNGAQPLATNELRQAATARGGVQAQGRESTARVQVLGRGTAQPQPLPMHGAAVNRADAAGERGMPSRGAPAAGNRAPMNSPNANAVTRDPSIRGQAGATDRSTLPSARFAPRRGGQGNETQGNGNAAPVRGNAAQSDRRAQAVTPVDAQNPRTNNGAGRQGDTRTFERQTPQTRTTTPAGQSENPSVQRETRMSPQQRYTQPQQQVREAPQREMRQAPQRDVREAQQQRFTPPPQQPQVREAPQREMRQAPQREVREAPQQRFTPQPQQQQPQVREAPQREMRQAQPQAQAQPRAEPRAQSDDRSGKKKDDEDKGRR